jgi:NADPH:quinone reductase-like Zn-dependent oxidoreductase
MDIAGTVEDVGAEVTAFKKGDRVAALGPSLPTGKQEYAAYQLYTLVPVSTASMIPDHVLFKDAAVLPLGLTTACWGLFEKGYLEIDPPSASGTVLAGNKEKAILVWGGSSSVGACAIQLLAAGGYTVIATASTANFQIVKSFGATHVFDHNDLEVTEKLVDTARGKEVLGAYDAISSEDTMRACGGYLHSLGGGKYMRTIQSADTSALPATVTVVGGAIPPLRGPNGELALWNRVWVDFVGEGLTNGKLQTKPDAFVLHGGLKRLNDAVDMVRKGVSARKVVVEVVEEPKHE